MKDFLEPGLTSLFVEQLFGDTKVWIEFLLTKKNQPPIQFFYHGIGDIDWTKIYELNANGYDVFYSPCGRSAKSGKKIDVSFVPCLWVDIDDKELAKDLDKIYSYVGTLNTPDIAYVVCSGHGLHLYWIFNKPARIKCNEDRLRFEGYLFGLANHLNADKCWDLGRRLRLPESINWKNPNEPVSCYIVNDYIFYSDYESPSLRSFDQFYSEPPSSRTRNIIFADGLPEVDISGLPEDIQELIKNPPKKGNRSEAVYKVIAALRKAGRSADEALAVLMKYSIGERYDE